LRFCGEGRQTVARTGVLLRNTAPIRCNLSLRRPVKPPYLRRTPAKPVVVRPNAPALGPPGDSVDDF
jgi:hypothetical protein